VAITRRAVIGAHFLFWQQYHDSNHGGQYVSYYLRHNQQLPHVGVIDPRTGELCKALAGFVTAERLLDLLMTYADKDLQPMPSIDALHVPSAAATIDRAPAPPVQPAAATAGGGGGLPATGGRTLGGGTPAMDAAQVPSDPAADDAFWAERAPGPEPAAPAPGVVRLVVRLPDGSRAKPRAFETSTALGTVLAYVHMSGNPLSSAREWKLVQSMPKGELRGLDSPLSGLVDAGSAMLLLDEDC